MSTTISNICVQMGRTSYENFFFLSALPVRRSTTFTTSDLLPTATKLPQGLHAILILFPAVESLVLALEAVDIVDE